MIKAIKMILLVLVWLSSCLTVSAADDVFDLPLNAVQSAADAVVDLGNILVGGKRLGSPFSEFVASNKSSSQVISREDMRISGSQNLPQALSTSPGVILTDLSGNGEEPTVDFRGFNQGQDLVFLLDGVRLNEPKSNNINFPLIPIHLAERIEINRGGASSLYGEGATGGVVNIVGLMPKEDGLHGKVDSLAGSFGEWGESFEASVKQGGTGVYMTGDIYHTRGFRQNSSVEKEHFYAKAVQELSEKARLSATYLYADALVDRSGSIRETLLDRYGREATERPRNFSDMDSQLGILGLDLIPAESVAVSGNAFLRRSTELSVANFATFDTFDNELDLTVDAWGFTLQADHSKGILWDLTEGFLLGMDYVRNDIDEEDFDRSKATLRRLSQVVDSNASKETFGVFSKTSLSWNERVGAYAGVRYDHIDFRNRDLILTGNDDPSEISKVSASTGGSIQLTEPLSWSILYSRSFRSPTLSDLYANPAFGSNSALKPEQSEDYETGLQWLDRNVLAKSTFFFNRRANEIGFDPNQTDSLHPFGTNTNFGKTQRVGVENFIESKVLPWLRLRTSHTYIEAVFKTNTPGGAQISGDHIPMVPRNRYAAGVLIQPAKDLDINLDMVSVSKQVLTNDLTNDRNGERLPAYTVFDLSALYRYKSWEFSFEVRNLFDEEYETGGSLGAAPSVFNTDRTVEDNFFVPAPGRSFGGRVSYSW